MNMLSISELSKLSFPFILASLIVGCNDNEESQKDTPKSETAIQVYDGILSLTPNKKDYVDLEPYIISGSSTEAELTNVTLLTIENDDCGDALIEDDSLGFYTQVNGSAMCEYQYTVETNSPAAYSSVGSSYSSVGSSSLSGIITVVASTSSTPSFPSIPYAVALTGGDVKIEIDKELSDIGETYPTNYTLSDDYMLVGDGSVSIDSPSRIIDYTATSPGPKTIVYRLLDPVGQEHYFGFIEISVSDGLNQAPIAQDDAVYPTKVDKGVDTTIDITGYVESPDGDDFELVKVDSINATVSLGDLSNKEFVFNSSITGDHFVSFVVSDHKGGFDTGLLKLTVEDPEQRGQWGNGYFVGARLYTAPLSYSESIDAGVVTSFYDDDGYTPNIAVATFSATKAEEYCASIGGSIPSDSAFNQLFSAHFDKDQSEWEWPWPSNLPYWVDAGGDSFELFDLTTGFESSLDSTRDYYLTCEFSALTKSNIDSNAVANGADEVVVEVMFKNVVEPVEGAELELTIEGDLKDSLVVNADSLVTNSDGIARFTATSLQAGEATLKITYYYTLGESEPDRFEESVSQQVSFVGDEATAKLDSVTVSKSGAVPDGISTNKVQATVVDVNNNPVPGVLVSFSASDDEVSLVQAPSTLQTNKDGIVEASFVSSALITSTITAEFGGTSQSVDIGFYPGPLDMGNGKLFTPSPSVLYLDSIGGGYTNGEAGESATGTFPGVYYRFNWSNASALCETYNSNSVSGRTNWSLATSDELYTELYLGALDLLKENGWPRGYYYWSSTSNADGSGYFNVSLSGDVINVDSGSGKRYASCVSTTDGVATESIDIFDTGSGQLFTSSPSIAYLDSIGGSDIADSNNREAAGKGVLSFYYLYSYSNAHALCDTYSRNSLGGRTNWHLPTEDELIGLYNTFGSMYSARRWPTSQPYWTTDFFSSPYVEVNRLDHSGVRLDTGVNGAYRSEGSVSDSFLYASCVSEP